MALEHAKQSGILPIISGRKRREHVTMDMLLSTFRVSPFIDTFNQTLVGSLLSAKRLIFLSRER